jgi:hypothetical protein
VNIVSASNQAFVPLVQRCPPIINVFVLSATLSSLVFITHVVSECSREELNRLHAKYLKYFVSMYGFTSPMMWEKSEWIEFIKTHMIGTREVQNYRRNLRSVLGRGRIERTGMDAVLEMMTSVFGNDTKLKKIVSGMESVMRLGGPPAQSSRNTIPRPNASPTATSSSSSSRPSIPRPTPQPVPSNHTSNPSPQSPPSSTSQDFISLDALIQNGTPASSLTIRQLKNILLLERVSMSATLEKQELVDKVDMLLRNRRIEMEIVNRSDGISPASSAGTSPARTQPDNGSPRMSESQHPASMFNIDDLLCKVCLALPTNCVFLECGHLVCCMDCGTLIFKTQKLCCVCRAPITRIVHTFRV